MLKCLALLVDSYYATPGGKNENEIQTGLILWGADDDDGLEAVAIRPVTVESALALVRVHWLRSTK